MKCFLILIAIVPFFLASCEKEERDIENMLDCEIGTVNTLGYTEHLIQSDERLELDEGIYLIQDQGTYDSLVGDEALYNYDSVTLILGVFYTAADELWQPGDLIYTCGERLEFQITIFDFTSGQQQNLFLLSTPVEIVGEATLSILSQPCGEAQQLSFEVIQFHEYQVDADIDGLTNEEILEFLAENPDVDSTLLFTWNSLYVGFERNQSVFLETQTINSQDELIRLCNVLVDSISLTTTRGGSIFFQEGIIRSRVISQFDIDWSKHSLLVFYLRTTCHTDITVNKITFSCASRLINIDRNLINLQNPCPLLGNEIQLSFIKINKIPTGGIEIQ